MTHVGQYFETILDQFSHILTYSCLGFLYPQYIVFFFVEIAVEQWPSTFHYFVQSIPSTNQKWPDDPSFLTRTCSLPLWDHPNLRWYRWYGSDLFHTLLIVRYILIHQNDLYWVLRLKRYTSMNRIFTCMKFLIVLMGISSFLRLILGSCYLLDNLRRLGTIKKF